MDNAKGRDFNVADAYTPPTSPLPEADLHFSRDRSTTKGSGFKPRGVLRRLAGRWWQLLLLWLLVSAPIAFSIFKFIEPTYEASSLLHIEPLAPELFTANRLGERQDANYLKTEVTVLASDKMLESVVANAVVVNLPMIKKSVDPKKDLREKLKVEIIDNTNLIRVSLELPNRDDAITIVQAVIDAYKARYAGKHLAENSLLKEGVQDDLKKLTDQIEAKKSELRKLHQEEKVAAFVPQEILGAKIQADPTQPFLSNVPEGQYAKFLDRLAQCDFDCLEAQSRLEAARSVRARNQNKIDEELETLGAAHFKKDPRVVVLINQIGDCKKRAESKEQAPPSAVLVTRETLEKLSKEYKALWASEFPAIRLRLSDADLGMLSNAKIRELEVAVETASRTRTAYAKQLEKMQVVEKPGSNDTFKANYLTYQLNSLLSREDQVIKHVEQLKFEASREHYRVTLLDPASAPRSPANVRRLKYMAAAPVYVFISLLVLFLVQEIMAGRSHATPYARASD
jgi:capsular polysaccharide biosynthesis protein